jgi:hypothetical protein
MDNRRTLFGYISIAVALAAGCLYANTASTTPAPDPNALESAAAYAKLAGFRFAIPFPEDTTDRSVLPAEKVYKNITTLKGITAGELLSDMTFISNSLGVRCGFCHVQGDFASDDKPEKNTARGMIHMTEDINTRNFSAQTVSCYTCHNGHPRPMAVPSLSQGDWMRLDFTPAQWLKHDSTTTVDAVLDRYVQALGGQAALAKVTSRVMQANEAQVGGGTSKVDIYGKWPAMYRSVTTSSDPKRGTSTEVYNGNTGWLIFGNRMAGKANESELEELVRAAEFYPAIDLKRAYTNVALAGKERVGDKDYYVVTASRNDRTADKLYFDASTGLLARRYVEFHTSLGAIPFAIEYGDYIEENGVKVPHTIKWSTPRESWTDTITQLRNNVAIADSMFAKPR